MTIYVATSAGEAGKAPRNSIKANGASKAASRLQDQIVWRSRRAAETHPRHRAKKKSLNHPLR